MAIAERVERTRKIVHPTKPPTLEKTTMNPRIESHEATTFDAVLRCAPRALLLSTVALGATALGGCSAHVGDGLETSEDALTAQVLVEGTTTRRMTSTPLCLQVCTGYYYTHPKPGVVAKHCSGYRQECSSNSAASLFADDGAVARNEVFPAYDEGPSWTYLGCGPQAAQNVLNYYGAPMPIADVAQYIPTFALEAGQSDQFVGGIATLPDSLVSGLQNLLDARGGGGTYVVQKTSDQYLYRNIIQNEVSHGNPVILMVQGGNHYQVVTGYEPNGAGGDRFHVIDYAGNDAWVNESDMDLGLSGAAEVLHDAAWLSTLGFSDGGGLNDHTVITIDFTPTP